MVSSPSYFWSYQLSQLFSKFFNPLLKLGGRNYGSKSLSIFKNNDTMVKKQGQHKQSQNCYTKVLSQQIQKVSNCCQIIHISISTTSTRSFKLQLQGILWITRPHIHENQKLIYCSDQFQITLYFLLISQLNLFLAVPSHFPLTPSTADVKPTNLRNVLDFQ